jgi:phosphatidylglycerol lysyltransferase
VAVAESTLEGKRGQPLRHSVNRAKREGLAFALLEHPLPETTWEELQRISDAWLAHKATAEKGFSLGRFERAYLSRSPLTVVRQGSRIVAFANLVPGYGGREELTIDLMRHVSDMPYGTMDFLFVSLIELARTQGYRYFSLGMAPLSGVGETRYARAGERLVRLLYEYGDRFYNYKGLRSFKEKFYPEWHSAYLAYPLLVPVAPLLVDIAALIAGGYRRILFMH